jgi:hypothetical protein
MTSDREIKQAYQRTLATHGQETRDNCVSPEAILSLVEGSEGEEARLHTLDHVMACRHCREDFELLRGLARSRPVEERSKKRWGISSPQRLAWAASLVIALGAGSLWWGSQGSGPEGVMRGDGTELRLVSPAAGGTLDEGMTFAWNSLPQAFSYEMEVIDADGEVVFRFSTPDTVVVAEGLSSAVLAEGLSWWVTARTRDGSRISSPISPLFAARR